MRPGANWEQLVTMTIIYFRCPGHDVDTQLGSFGLPQKQFNKKLQNAGPLLTIHQTSWLVWLGSGKNSMALSVEFICLAAHLAWQWMKE